MGLPRGTLQAQLELGTGEEARGIQHYRDQPADEPVRVGAEAPEEGNPVAEADTACAVAAAARRRGHGSQRRGELRGGKTGGTLAQARDLPPARAAPA